MTEESGRKLAAVAETAATGAHDIILDAPGGRVSFRGYLIKSISTRAGSQPRWTELALYKVTDDAGGYVLRNTGKSVLYHRPGEPCNLGVSARVGDLDDDRFNALEPHVTTIERFPGDPKALAPCYPPDLDDLDPDTVIAAELDLNGIRRCPTVRAVLEGLEQVKWDQGSRTRFLSEPAQRLLAEAADLDSDIAEMLAEVREL